MDITDIKALRHWAHSRAPRQFDGHRYIDSCYQLVDNGILLTEAQMRGLRNIRAKWGVDLNIIYTDLIHGMEQEIQILKRKREEYNKL